ncbi:MAG: sodium/glutamate symporter [Candidatus Latescibacteria bacterium]|nr:sodium/glutamate symporter [Candidatus Latescibacterota bacterium]
MMTWTVNPWWVLALACPVLLLGEFLVRRIRWLARFNIPVSVAGGLTVALFVLAVNLSGVARVALQTDVSARWWTWLVTSGAEWTRTPSAPVNRPFLVAFFTCIGLNVSWRVARRGGWPMLMFLFVTTLLAVVQNGVGIGLAHLLGASPLLGLVCGAVTLTGGHGTSAGFADAIAAAGLPEAAVFGAAAATFGLMTGSLVGGPVGGFLVRRKALRPGRTAVEEAQGFVRREADFLRDVRTFAGYGWKGVLHLLVLLACIKAGAEVSALMVKVGLKFPVYIGSMLLGVLLRNALDLLGKRWIRTEVVGTLSVLMLGLFLSISLMSLQLANLANAALPMLVILCAQVVVMALFAAFVTYPLMGRDYDGAVMAGGHCGFGLGNTANAMATMEVLVERFGPSPRAFLIVPVVGGFLLDFTNALVITVTLNWIG